jgi:hypothetical protein
MTLDSGPFNFLMYDYFEYSLDKKNWNKFDEFKHEFHANIEFDNDIWIRGKSKVGTGYCVITFKNPIPVDVDGDIRTLVDWEKYKTCDTSNATFTFLFSGCE